MASGESVVGSVLGYLRLDADQFHREIDKAVAGVEYLEHQDATVKIKATGSESVVRGARSASAGIDSVSSASRRLEDATGRVRVAQARLNEMRASGTAKASSLLAAEQGLSKALRSHSDAMRTAKAAGVDLADVNHKIDQSAQSATKSVKGFGGSVGGIPAPVAIAGVAAGLALVGPVAGAATAGIAGFTGVLGVSVLAFKGFKNEMAAGSAIGTTLNGRLTETKSVLQQLEATSARAMAPGLLSSMAAINGFLPQMNGEVKTLSGHLGNALSISAGGLVSGLRTAMPLLQDGGHYAEVLAQKFADFTQSQDFRNFIDYARAELPQVTAAVGSLASGLVDVSVALAPVGDQLVGTIDMAGKAASALGPVIKGLEFYNNTSAGAAARRIYDQLSGGADKAAESTDKHTTAIARMDQSLTRQAGLFGTTTTALQAAADAQTKTATTTSAATVQMQLQNDAAGILKQSLDALNGEALSAADAQNAFDSSLVNMGTHTTATGKKIHFTTANINNMSSASVALRGQLNGQVANLQRVVEANGGLNDSTGKARGEMVKMRKQIIDNAVAHGVDRKAVTSYIDEILKVPDSVPPTKLDVQTGGAVRKLTAFQKMIDDLHGKNVAVSVSVLTGTFNKLNANPKLKAAGGHISGPGSGTSDSIPAMLSNGEYVINAASASRIGRGTLDRLNRYANGGPIGYASGGGVTVPLGQFYSNYVSSLGSTVTKSDLAKDRAAVAAATTRLHLAEMKLEKDRASKHRTAYQIAQDEASIARARLAVASATSKAATASAHYQMQRVSALTMFQRGTSIGVSNGAAFISNIETLASRGFGTLAQQLAAMGGPEAERIAAQAAHASSARLGSISRSVNRGVKNEQTMSHIDGITAILSALRSHKGGGRALASLTGIDLTELMTSAGMIRGQLAKMPNARSLLADLAKWDKGQLFANGGFESHMAQIAPAGAMRVWAEPETGGEAYIPLSPAKRARSTAIWQETGRRLGAESGGQVTLDRASIQALAVALSRVQVRTSVSAGSIDRALVAGMR